MGRAGGWSRVVVGPLALWAGYLWWACGEPGVSGVHNFSAPLAEYFAKWSDAIARLRVTGSDIQAKWMIVMLVSLTVQFLTIALRPQWQNLWWRIGVPYALLLIFLGSAVWEGYPGAASRVVLPLTLAFNMVVPRSLRWWPVLVLGNLSALSFSEQLRAPGLDAYEVEGPRTVIQSPAGESIRVAFSPEWYPAEKSSREYWRWCRGSGDVVIHNPQDFPVEAVLKFALRSDTDRTVRVLEQRTIQRWEGLVGRGVASVTIAPARLEPGDNVWRFETDQRPIIPIGPDPRPFAFNLRNLVIEAVRGIEPAAAPP